MLKTNGADERLPESCFVVVAGLVPGANVAIARRGRRGVEVTSMNFGEEKMARAAVRVVDIHSHGEGAAFLSSTDRQDTRGATAVVMVAGKVSEPKADIVAYLYLQGMPLAIPWSDSGDIAADPTEGRNGKREASLDQR